MAPQRNRKLSKRKNETKFCQLLHISGEYFYRDNNFSESNRGASMFHFSMNISQIKKLSHATTILLLVLFVYITSKLFCELLKDGIDLFPQFAQVTLNVKKWTIHISGSFLETSVKLHFALIERLEAVGVAKVVPNATFFNTFSW